MTLHSASPQSHGGSRAMLALHVYAPLWVLNRSQLPLQYQLKRRLLVPMATKGRRKSRRARPGLSSHGHAHCVCACVHVHVHVDAASIA